MKNARLTRFSSTTSEEHSVHLGGVPVETRQSCILVTGGAGYIGSHTVKMLVKAGHKVIVLDNLSKGYQEAIPAIPLEVVDLRDKAKVEAVFGKYPIEAVIHFAALVAAGESVDHPDEYFEINIGGGLNLLAAMRTHKVDKLVFSSSCAVYGDPERNPVTEDSPTKPISPYGLTKLQFEQILASYDRAFGLKSIALRYFNAVGADPEGELGNADPKPTKLIEVAVQHALGQRPTFELYGTDYPTPDGTAIRDYVHVADLAEAHVRALDYLIQTRQSDVFNLGADRGFSVREVLKALEEQTGKQLKIIERPRRPGDPAQIVGSSVKAREKLNWQPRYSHLDTIIKTAWSWAKSHPSGYHS